VKVKKALPFLALFAEGVRAHCPLCTMGAIAAVGGASILGVNQAAIGVFIGAFAASTGWWASTAIQKRGYKIQTSALVLFSFFATILPMLPFMDGIYPLYFSVAGGYGSLLNRTYLLNIFLVGSILGASTVSAAPAISAKIAGLRKKMLPFQGIILTFALLFIEAAFLQAVL